MLPSRGLIELYPGRPNGYLEYQAMNMNPHDQLTDSTSNSAFASMMADAIKRRREAAVLSSRKSNGSSIDNNTLSALKGVG